MPDKQADEPNYVVLRPSPDFPAHLWPLHLDGKWLDLNEIQVNPDKFKLANAEAEPTGRFEYREGDLAVAEVWEIRLRS